MLCDDNFAQRFPSGLQLAFTRLRAQVLYADSGEIHSTVYADCPLPIPLMLVHTFFINIATQRTQMR